MQFMADNRERKNQTAQRRKNLTAQRRKKSEMGQVNIMTVTSVKIKQD